MDEDFWEDMCVQLALAGALFILLVALAILSIIIVATFGWGMFITMLMLGVAGLAYALMLWHIG